MEASGKSTAQDNDRATSASGVDLNVDFSAEAIRKDSSAGNSDQDLNDDALLLQGLELLEISSDAEKSLTDTTTSWTRVQAVAADIQSPEIGVVKDSLIRDQNFQSVLKKSNDVNWKNKALAMSSWSACILNSEGTPIGGGIILCGSILLTNRHMFENQSDITDWFAVFNDFNGDQEYKYAISFIDTAIYMNVAEELNVQMMSDTDDVLLLNVAKAEDQFPKTWCSVVNHEPDYCPKVLTHFGFTARNGNLHISQTEVRMMDAYKLLRLNGSLAEENIIYGPQLTQGKVIAEAVTPESPHTPEIHTLSIKTPKKSNININMTRTPDSAERVYKNGATSKLSKVSAVRTNILESDHAIVGHKTSFGSCGGGYWDLSLALEDSFFGIHAGRKQDNSNASEDDSLIDDEQNLYHNHLVLRVNQKRVTSDLYANVIQEGRGYTTFFNKVKDFKKYFGRAVLEDNKHVGYLRDVKRSDTNVIFLVKGQPNNPQNECTEIVLNDKVAVTDGLFIKSVNGHDVAVKNHVETFLEKAKTIQVYWVQPFQNAPLFIEQNVYDLLCAKHFDLDVLVENIDYEQCAKQIGELLGLQCVAFLEFLTDESKKYITLSCNLNAEMAVNAKDEMSATDHAEFIGCLILYRQFEPPGRFPLIYLSNVHFKLQRAREGGDHSVCVSCRNLIAGFLGHWNNCCNIVDLTLCYGSNVTAINPFHEKAK